MGLHTEDNAGRRSTVHSGALLPVSRWPFLWVDDGRACLGCRTRDSVALKAGATQPISAAKQGALDDIGTRWSKFSKHDLSAPKNNDDLVTKVVAKYGLEKAAAQHDVDAVMKGRKV